MLIPINGLAALADGVRRSPIILFWIVVVVPAETKIPDTVPDALFASRLYILFLENIWVVPPVVLEIPVTAEAPVLLKV